MAEAFFSAVNYPLSLLIQNIESGEIALSGIQRPFVWPNSRVRDLFDSMYRGFPVGYLLFAPYERWQAGSASGPRLLIVDGQQRLTSLFSVLKGTTVMREDFREEKIEIAFRPADGRFELSDAAVRRDPEFVPDIGPALSGQAHQYRFVREFLERLRAHRPVDDAEEARLSTAIYHLCDLRSYPFTALQLSRSLDEEQVAEVFVRINSRGVPLGIADFILTLMAVSWEDGRRQLETFCRETRKAPVAGPASPANYLLHPTPDQLLKVIGAIGFGRARLGQIYSVLQGLDAETRQPSAELRAAQFERLRAAQDYALDPEHWQEFLETARAAGYGSAELISSPAALLHCYAIFLIGKRDAGVKDAALRDIAARWISFTLLTSRYSGSGDSNLEADLARLREVDGEASFLSTLDETMEAELTDEYWTAALPDALATTATRSAAFLGFCAALCAQGTTGLFSEAKVSEYYEGRRDLIERRHLFPRKQLARAGRSEGRETNQVANLVFVAPEAEKWASSGECAARLARSGKGKAGKIECLHALPEGWAGMEYGAFLEARRTAMAGVIREAVTSRSIRRPGPPIPLHTR